MPACVGDSVREHLLFNNAQLGAGHAVSNRSTDAVTEAHNVVKVTLLNSNAPGQLLCGPQSQQKAVRILLSWQQWRTSMAAPRARLMYAATLTAAGQLLHGPQTCPANWFPPLYMLTALKTVEPAPCCIGKFRQPLSCPADNDECSWPWRSGAHEFQQPAICSSGRCLPASWSHQDWR